MNGQDSNVCTPINDTSIETVVARGREMIKGEAE